jgi:hypothetical protein
MTPAPTKPSEALRAARELLSDPKRWTKGELARTDEGLPTNVIYDDAVCFCAEGAILRATKEDSFSSFRMNLSEKTLNFVRKAIGKDEIYEWNDRSKCKHSDIMAGFTRAIALAEEAGQ